MTGALVGLDWVVPLLAEMVGVKPEPETASVAPDVALVVTETVLCGV